ncbi:uncharacterized protein RAG0_06224 [Rhynchosporium agropyri]|uniref:Uncharacterized protein n=1 Tax=Rhynchosporium agropyri TaxID=914238 RepID=A0A1E1KGI5_9HELO|nr:uncharacterized protein RAG0_06224 [Rhynchosporium agropyri]
MGLNLTGLTSRFNSNQISHGNLLRTGSDPRRKRILMLENGPRLRSCAQTPDLMSMDQPVPYRKADEGRARTIEKHLLGTLLAFSVSLNLTGRTPRVDFKQICPATPLWIGSDPGESEYQVD